MKLYIHLYKNTYRWCEKFRNIPNKSRFFLFFRPKTHKIAIEKIKKIDTYSEYYETLHIIYIYFYRVVYKVS